LIASPTKQPTSFLIWKSKAGASLCQKHPNKFAKKHQPAATARGSDKTTAPCSFFSSCSVDGFKS
jgi:hypothetical protein